MAFRPRMETDINGFSVFGGPRSRVFDGVVVDLWDVRCDKTAGGHYVGRDPRLVFMLDVQTDAGGRLTMQHRKRGNHAFSAAEPITFVPADEQLSADFSGVRFLRHLDLRFDPASLAKRLAQDIDPEALLNPRLMFHDARLLALATLIAGECDNDDPLHPLYGESLVLALLTDFLKVRAVAERKRTKLAAWQLRVATDYLRDHCLRGVRLQELAELTNLSQSQFSHAFKASTGLPPHQWQMRARIDRVKDLLRERRLPLTDIAMLTGFSDQAHFSRVFRKMVGLSPSVWQRHHR